MRIDDGDLTLRPWQPGDAEAVYRAAQDPLIPRYTTLPDRYEMSHAEKFVGDVAPAGWAAGTSANFAVLDRDAGTLLGSCGLVWIRDGLAELGYWTAAAARGRSVALRASRLVCRYAFEERQIARISWQAEVGNHASRLVALRCGFHIDGTWQFRATHPQGLPDGWIGTLLPGQLLDETPQRYAAGSLAARRARVFGATPPVLTLAPASAPGTAPKGGLRAPADRDLDAITRACQDPEIPRWTSVPDPYRRSDAEYFVGRYARGGWARGTAAVFAIADERDDWVGSIDLRLGDPESTEAEVGFLVDPNARGRGYATAALGTLTAWGFDVLGLDRIRWRAEVGNHASRRVAEKAGFQAEGIERGTLPGRSGSGVSAGDDSGGHLGDGSGHRRGLRDAWVAARLATDPR
jgi:RimJ/RimL family protein N-acetyltransferase